MILHRCPNLRPQCGVKGFEVASAVDIRLLLSRRRQLLLDLLLKLRVYTPLSILVGPVMSSVPVWDSINDLRHSPSTRAQRSYALSHCRVITKDGTRHRETQ